MAIVNATDVVIKLIDGAGNTPTANLLFATSASLSISMDLRDSTTKASNGFQDNLAGLKSWEVSGDGFVDLTSTANSTKGLITQMLSATPEVEVRFGTTASGEFYTGSAFITSISIDAGVEENATYSISLQGNGALA